ncbi:MAG: hypothetical protein PHW74_02325 [Desulfobacca sp.]|nr:hypothetical protein [Desulfobacca sp.]
MKKNLALTLSLTLVLWSSAVALAYTIDDLSPAPYTELERWTGGKAVGGGYAGDSVFQDVLAANNEFATDQITIAFNPFTIQIWTNNKPGGWVVGSTNFGVADIAINAGPQVANYDAITKAHFGNIPSPFELGINMQTYALGVPGLAPLVQVGMWTTTFAINNPLGSGFQYGGAYRPAQFPPIGETSPVETLLSNAAPTGWVGNLTWVVNDVTLNPKNAIPDYLITVAFPGQPSMLTAGFELLWGTAECGNDIVHDPNVVPLPGALLLLGLGMIRLMVYRRRKVK